MRLSLVTLGDPARLTGGYLYHRRMAEAAPPNGAELAFVSVPEQPFPLPLLAARRLLAQLPPADAVLVDSIAAAFVAPWLGRVRAPVIAVVHQPPGGIDHGVVRRSLQARLDRAAYRRAQLLIVASDALAMELHHQGFAEDKVVVVPPGRDVATAPPAEGLRRGRRAALLCVANWLPRKGVLPLLEAVSALRRDAATLHLAGDDNADVRYARRVRQRLAHDDLHERVVVHGRLSSNEVAALYAGADVFVLPSTREPYGTAYGEAMAAGLPVVGWRAGNIVHLARHEREGLHVAPGDIAGLTNALARLVDDAQLRARMSRAAAERARAFPTWAESSQRFFAAIARAL